MPDVFEKVFEVRWDDIDFNGHLRNTRYAEYANYTWLVYFQERDFPLNRMIDAGIGPVLLSEQAEYRKEAFLAQSLAVRVQVVGMSPDGARWRAFHTFLHPDGTTAATRISSFAWVDIKDRKLVAPPPELKSLLEAVRSAHCETIEE